MASLPQISNVFLERTTRTKSLQPAVVYQKCRCCFTGAVRHRIARFAGCLHRCLPSLQSAFDHSLSLENEHHHCKLTGAVSIGIGLVKINTKSTARNCFAYLLHKRIRSSSGVGV